MSVVGLMGLVSHLPWLLTLVRLPHPAAGATTLIVGLGILHSPASFAVMACAIVLLTALGWALNLLLGVRPARPDARVRPSLRSFFGLLSALRHGAFHARRPEWSSGAQHSRIFPPVPVRPPEPAGGSHRACSTTENQDQQQYEEQT